MPHLSLYLESPLEIRYLRATQTPQSGRRGHAGTPSPTELHSKVLSNLHSQECFSWEYPGPGIFLPAGSW